MPTLRAIVRARDGLCLRRRRRVVVVAVRLLLLLAIVLAPFDAATNRPEGLRRRRVRVVRRRVLDARRFGAARFFVRRLRRGFNNNISEPIIL